MSTYVALVILNSNVLIGHPSSLNTRSLMDGRGQDMEVVDARLRYRLERELDRVRPHPHPAG